MFQLFGNAVGQVAMVSILIGAGLPALFAFGIRAMAIGAGGSAEVSDAPGRPAMKLVAYLCFALVIAVIAWVVTLPDGVQLPGSAADWARLLYMSIVAGALAMLGQTWAQAHLPAVRTAIIDPGATRTQMRARAYPGEDPASVKPPEDVARAIVQLLAQDFESTHYLKL